MSYRSRGLSIVTAFLIAFGVAACKSSEPAQTGSTTADNKSDMEALYWERVNESRMSFSEADVHFMTGMIAHHAQALIMSRLAPDNGASQEIQTLASRIINAQKDEIASMRRWLQDREQPVPDVQIDGIDLTILVEEEPFTMYKKMTGVLSDDQLQELADARGEMFDRLYLEYMIEHHTGAVHMVKNLFATDGAAQDEEAFRLASDIQVDQITEVERMKLMLENITES